MFQCGCATDPSTPHRNRELLPLVGSLQILQIDGTSCELGGVRAVVVLRHHRRLLGIIDRRTRISFQSRGGTHRPVGDHKADSLRMQLDSNSLVLTCIPWLVNMMGGRGGVNVTCNMLTGRSTVSWEWELEG